MTKRVSEGGRIDAQKIDRALEEISRYSMNVRRSLLVVCDPNGVVRREEGGERD